MGQARTNIFRTPNKELLEKRKPWNIEDEDKYQKQLQAQHLKDKLETRVRKIEAVLYDVATHKNRCKYVYIEDIKKALERQERESVKFI